MGFTICSRPAKYAITSHFTHMWIPRAIEPRLRQLAATRPVVVLTGARQTGKTSTLRRLFPNHDFVSLDLPSEAEQAEEAPGVFLQRHPPPVVLDEVKYAPALFRHLKSVVDARRDRAGQFLLTGSQKFTLMKGVSESLAGRAAILELEPLAFAELRAARPRTALLDLIVRGGMPGLYARAGLDHVSFHNLSVFSYSKRTLRFRPGLRRTPRTFVSSSPSDSNRRVFPRASAAFVGTR
jgi:predicted AAA+ superfamily ATPase